MKAAEALGLVRDGDDGQLSDEFIGSVMEAVRPHRRAVQWGRDAVDAACARALEVEAANVGLIGRMLERATENEPPAEAPPAAALPGASPSTPSTSPWPASCPSTTPEVRREPAGTDRLARVSRPCFDGSSSAACSTPCLNG